ncbi:hypothetical protein BST61_g9076 [Cercospora zeina]
MCLTFTFFLMQGWVDQAGVLSLTSKDTVHEKLHNSEQIPPRYSADDIESGAALIPGQQEAQRRNITLPAETDTANTVRCFIRDTLTTAYDSDINEAERIASKWTLGTGRELRSDSPHLFRAIFGDEAGWVLYKDVQVQKHLEKEAKTPRKKQSTKGQPLMGLSSFENSHADCACWKALIAAATCASIIPGLVFPTIHSSKTWEPLVIMIWVVGILLVLLSNAVAISPQPDSAIAADYADASLKMMYQATVTRQ